MGGSSPRRGTGGEVLARDAVVGANSGKSCGSVLIDRSGWLVDLERDSLYCCFRTLRPAQQNFGCHGHAAAAGSEPPERTSSAAWPCLERHHANMATPADQIDS